jgi:hypothetical protein
MQTEADTPAVRRSEPLLSTGLKTFYSQAQLGMLYSLSDIAAPLPRAKHRLRQRGLPLMVMTRQEAHYSFIVWTTCTLKKGTGIMFHSPAVVIASRRGNLY